MQSTSMPERGRTEAATGQTPSSPAQCSRYAWCTRRGGHHETVGCSGKPVSITSPLVPGVEHLVMALAMIETDRAGRMQITLDCGLDGAPVSPDELRAYARQVIEQASSLFQLAGEFEAARVAEMASAA